MSLAPNERRVLALIEDSLYISDPRLADMLATFEVPRWRRIAWGCRGLLSVRTVRRRTVAVVAGAMSCLIFLAWVVVSILSQPVCARHLSPPGGSGLTAVCQVSGTSGTGNGPAKTATARQAARLACVGDGYPMGAPQLNVPSGGSRLLSR